LLRAAGASSKNTKENARNEGDVVGLETLVASVAEPKARVAALVPHEEVVGRSPEKSRRTGLLPLWNQARHEEEEDARRRRRGLRRRGAYETEDVRTTTTTA